MGKISMIRKQETVTLQQAFSEFSQNCKLKNLSESTVKNYESAYKKFTEFHKLEDVSLISQESVKQYILFLQRQLDNPISVNYYLRQLRAVFNFFAENDYMRPVNIKLLKAEQPLKEPYTDFELQLLLKKPDVKKCSFKEYRTWVIINFFISTGARIRSVMNVKIGDVDFENGLVKLAVTKNRKPQVLPIPQSMVQILKEYLKIRQGSSEDYLFCNSSGTQMLGNSVGHDVNEYNRSRGVLKTSMHLFRHTFAKNFILSGGDVFRLQKQLGHSTLDMSRKYANIWDVDLQQGFEQFNLHDRLSSQTQRVRMK